MFLQKNTDMRKSEFVDNIHYVGVNDRTKTLFESLWPLPYGVSYNAYLIDDEKTALIDTVDIAYTDRLIENVQNILGGRTLDYLVIHHMEPDHSAAIGILRSIYPDMILVGNAKTLDMVKGYYGIDCRTLTVKDGETLSFGKLELTFALTPMVHWPETMMSYCPQRQLLFAGDAFGCFGALDGGITDRELELEKYWNEMYRYYSNIVGKYGAPVQAALKKLAGIPVQTICSTHGPIWQEQVEKVIGLYNTMSLYQAEKGVVIAYGSMYGHTEAVAEEIAAQLRQAGVSPVIVHNVSYVHESYILRDIFRYDTLILGGPTYNGELFPPIAHLTHAIASRGIKQRKFGCFGSYTWAGVNIKRLTAFAEEMGWQTAENPVEIKQGFSADDKERCAVFARSIAELMNRE